MKTLNTFIMSGILSTVWAMSAQASSGQKMIAAAKATETLLGARVGVALIDTGRDDAWSYRGDERFPMASTSKTLACAALLAYDKQSDREMINKRDLQTYSPVTAKLVGKRVEASRLCDAAMRTSDNTAANKVLDAVGGPQRVTAFLRKIGDDVTRLDRNEPDLNEGTPGDERDTTTPTAMAKTMQKLVLQDGLTDANRRILKDWLISNEVGGPLMRAGVPKDWTVADRTGAGGFGTRGVAAVLWPPRGKPAIAVIYLTQTSASMDERNKAIANIAHAIALDMGDAEN